MHIQSTSIIAVCAILLAQAGCGNGRPKLVKTEGIVKLDGQPLEGAMVLFQRAPKDGEKFQRPSSGITNADGKFTLGTYTTQDGLPYGKYLVGIQKKDIVGNPSIKPGEEGSSSVNMTYKWITPKSYAEPAGSTLTAEVTSSGITPQEFLLVTNGQKPQIEVVGPRARANDP